MGTPCAVQHAGQVGPGVVKTIASCSRCGGRHTHFFSHDGTQNVTINDNGNGPYWTCDMHYVEMVLPGRVATELRNP